MDGSLHLLDRELPQFLLLQTVSQNCAHTDNRDVWCGGGGPRDVQVDLDSPHDGGQDPQASIPTLQSQRKLVLKLSPEDSGSDEDGNAPKE